MSVRILDSKQVSAILQRLAFEIYERNFETTSLYLVSTSEKGDVLAAQLATFLKKITSKKIHVLALAEVEAKVLKKQAVVLVDDVLYSGQTLFQALTKIHPMTPASLQATILIDRGHRRLPLAPTCVGMELATTLKEYVVVKIDKKKEKIEVFLE